MSEESTFIDELLEEAEAKEQQQTEAYFDVLLMQIQSLQSQISNNFAEAEKEVSMINQWALAKNHGIQMKIEAIERKLEFFIREKCMKTIELPHGTLRLHKKPDRVEVTDMDIFLKHAGPETVTIVPEQVKPDLVKIKSYLKSHRVPNGVTVIEGKEEFSYKLKEKELQNGRAQETGAAIESAGELRIVV